MSDTTTNLAIDANLEAASPFAPLEFNDRAALKTTAGRFAGDRARVWNYLPGDRLGWQRLRTWIPGAELEDGGQYASAPGGYWLADYTEFGEVDGEVYGLPLPHGQDVTEKDLAVERYCYQNRVGVFYGPGRTAPGQFAEYNWKEHNWAWSGIRDPGYPLKDYGGIRIRSTPQVVFKTESIGGADVMQCCGIKGFGVIGRPRGTAVLNNGGSTELSGSNGVSLVFGAVDVEFDIDWFDLPGIYKPDGGTDGGYAFTIQPGVGNTNPYSGVVIRGSAVRCVAGFGCDFAPDDIVLNPLSGIDCDGLHVEDCFRGVSIGGAAPTLAHSSQPFTGVSGRVTIRNCQQALLTYRSFGVNLEAEIVNTKTLPELIRHPHNTAVRLVDILAAKRGFLRVTGRVLSVDTPLRIGAARMGGIDSVATEQFQLEYNVQHTSATTAPIVIETLDGIAVERSIISLWGIPTGFAELLSNGGNSLFYEGAACANFQKPVDENANLQRVRHLVVVYDSPVTAGRFVPKPSNGNPGDVQRLYRTVAATGPGVGLQTVDENILPGTWIEATCLGGSHWFVSDRGQIP